MNCGYRPRDAADAELQLAAAALQRIGASAGPEIGELMKWQTVGAWHRYPANARESDFIFRRRRPKLFEGWAGLQPPSLSASAGLRPRRIKRFFPRYPVSVRSHLAGRF